MLMAVANVEKGCAPEVIHILDSPTNKSARSRCSIDGHNCYTSADPTTRRSCCSHVTYLPLRNGLPAHCLEGYFQILFLHFECD